MLNRRACSRTHTGMRARTTQGSPPHAPGRLSMPGKASPKSRAAYCRTWAFSARLNFASSASAASRTLIACQLVPSAPPTFRSGRNPPSTAKASSTRQSHLGLKNEQLFRTPSPARQLVENRLGYTKGCHPYSWGRKAHLPRKRGHSPGPANCVVDTKRQMG